MDAGWAALLGAVIGAVASIGATTLAEYWRHRLTSRQQRKDRIRHLFVRVGNDQLKYMRARIREGQRREIAADAKERATNPDEVRVRNNELALAIEEHDDRLMILHASRQELGLELTTDEQPIRGILEAVEAALTTAPKGSRPFAHVDACSQVTGAWHRGELSPSAALARYEELVTESVRP